MAYTFLDTTADSPVPVLPGDTQYHSFLINFGIFISLSASQIIFLLVLLGYLVEISKVV